MSQAFVINLQSSRARKARLGVWLGRLWLWAGLIIGIILSLVGWIVGIALLQLAAAHLLLGLGGLLLVAALWYEGELVQLPAGRGNSFEARLDQTVLGRLEDPVTPQSLAKVVMEVPGGWFYAARYGISKQFLEKLLSTDPNDTQRIFEKAAELTAEVPDSPDSITAAALTAALIFSIPNHEFYLAELQLDADDIVTGLHWEAHRKQVISRMHASKGGGIGRDLSFGWAPQLGRSGHNISEGIERGTTLRREIEGHDEVLQQVMHLMAQSGRRNAVLVGEVGAGKTTLVYALAQKLISGAKSVTHELRYRQVIELDAASLIARTRGGGELESLLIQLFNEAIHAKNIIIFLDEAHLFLQEGTGAVDLSNILMPVLEGGALQIILAVNDQEWLKLSQQNPGLTQLMNRVILKPLDEADTMRVIEDQVLLLEAQDQVMYTYQSLREAYKLAERFIRDQAFPGKAIRLLEAAGSFPEDDHFVTEKSVQQAVEKNFDVKVQIASTAQEKDILLNLEGKIHERMINQTRAVHVVSDALRRARSGVRNQDKPIGTFLFLGPTGVGKTELSKALAAVYFGGEDRLVRIDLNEYSQASDAARLLEVGAKNAHSLTAQIAKQPFSVVLLDEIEKAHPSVLDMLLQLLDEGMLRDSSNKPVSFRDAIIIATSNAGAHKIRERISAGQNLEQFEKTFVDELVDDKLFRPEFLNRFDEIVLFRPLEKGELMQVIDLIVASINKTLASQKVSVSLTEAAKAALVEAGYDPRLGARPLRRVAQRSIENIIAQKLLTDSVIPGSTVGLDAPEVKAILGQRQNQ